jgi:hypothetical protein
LGTWLGAQAGSRDHAPLFTPPLWASWSSASAPVARTWAVSFSKCGIAPSSQAAALFGIW